MKTLSDVPERLRVLLRCPRCAGRLTEANNALHCTCGAELTMTGGVLDALIDVDPALTDTFDSFGFEWTTFDQVNSEDERYWREYYFAEVPLETLRNATALDAGCGKARFSRFTASHVGTLVALDGSIAVRAAAQNLSDVDTALVIRGDLRHLPFATGAFQFVSCLGVLHHLPDPREGLASLAGALETGGKLLVYVYSRDERRTWRNRGLSAATAMRRITTKLPHRLLRALAAPMSAMLYFGIVVPGWAGERFRIDPLRRLPLSVYRGAHPRALWLDTFDRLSAPIEHRFTWSEIAAWFDEFGLNVLSVRDHAGLIIYAEKVDNR